MLLFASAREQGESSQDSNQGATRKVLTRVPDPWILVSRNPVYAPRGSDPSAIIGRVVWLHVSPLTDSG